MSKSIRVGLFGAYGHQLRPSASELLDPRVEVTAVSQDIHRESLCQKGVAGSMTVYESLETMLSGGEVDLVSLCSTRRADQPGHALQCLDAGVHVYAEKPAAFDESTLDRILDKAEKRGVMFREMAGTADTLAYEQVRTCVVSGQIGEVVQVTVQKSYPWHDRRPGDEQVDGGLIRQVGVHAFRLVEHVAGQRVEHVEAIETTKGNPRGRSDGCFIASAFLGRLEGGGVASVICNYLNPRGIGTWGNDEVHVFGTRGLVESLADGGHTRLVMNEQGETVVPDVAAPRTHCQQLWDYLHDGTPMRRELEDELHPTRIVIRAKEKAIALT